METCIFCNIAQKKMPSLTVYESNNILCFLDMDPINEGHVLIIPKAHYLDADELPDDVFIEIMRVSQRLLKTIKNIYHAPGYSIVQNGGVFNDIGHYHLHIFPRYHNDHFAWSFGEDIPEACNEEVAAVIRKTLLKHKKIPVYGLIY